MDRINIMINGLPGNMAKAVLKQALSHKHLNILPFSLTSPDIETDRFHFEGIEFELIHPDLREKRILSVIAESEPIICVDYSHPSAVNTNADFYCRHNLAFVMGTTGGERDDLLSKVEASSISAVIAPNMAKQIVGFQAMMAGAAKSFPNLFKRYQLTIRESHQSGKADTSGTAKAMADYFNKMGIDFSSDEIEKERNPDRQSSIWGVPPEHLNGHAWHTYTLTSQDKTVKFEFTHNVNGRDIYAEGTIDAIVFLAHKLANGSKGVVYSMIDVLKAGGQMQGA
ncbi:MAG: dihydrodipicolinate reductase [Desulfobacteraceae bacterium]|nr:dihydrodipicolinate reductase [Desulfobacteraceae bacterium]